MRTNYDITRFKQKITAPSFKSTQDGEAKVIRGFIPVTGGALINSTTAAGTHTLSLGSVVGTNSVAVVLAVRVQDTYSGASALVNPKASVDSTQRTGFKVFGKVSGELAQEQGTVPVNSTREVLYTLDQAVQTASVAVVGYYI